MLFKNNVLNAKITSINEKLMQNSLVFVMISQPAKHMPNILDICKFFTSIRAL
jgi:hypothetical protein